MLSVLLRFTDFYYYPFGIFKPVLVTILRHDTNSFIQNMRFLPTFTIQLHILFILIYEDLFMVPGCNVQCSVLNFIKENLLLRKYMYWGMLQLVHYSDILSNAHWVLYSMKNMTPRYHYILRYVFKEIF
jgi:hypothetical protein